MKNTIIPSPVKRSKVAVFSSNPKCDSVGACLGVRGMRVRNIISELRDEKLDIIKSIQAANKASDDQVGRPARQVRHVAVEVAQEEDPHRPFNIADAGNAQAEMGSGSAVVGTDTGDDQIG